MEKFGTAHKDFLDLFYPEIQNRVLDDCNTKLNLHILKIENNRFCYNEMVENLADNIVTFALTRKELDLLRNNEGKPYIKAVSRLRDYASNEGEFGEILLYCFLECHLGAPKIFTKMALKTSCNDYVKGADGVHILKLDEKNYQLIFGESKLRTTLRDAIYDALKSINNFRTRGKNNINDEIKLLNSKLREEALTDDLYDFLKKIIMPSAAIDDTNRDNAFGILAGFDIKVDEETQKLSNPEFRAKIRKDIKNEVENRIDYIHDKIHELGLQGYSFYIYAIPFTDLEEVRKRVIKNLKGATNDF